MRRIVLTALLAAAAFASGFPAEAQTRVRRGEVVAQRDVIRVTPRSWLDAGKVAPVGSLSQYAVVSHNQGYAPYAYISDRFGEGVLPGRGLAIPSHEVIFGGGANPFGPVDYEAPSFLR